MNDFISQEEFDFLYETTLDGLSNNLVKTTLNTDFFMKNKSVSRKNAKFRHLCKQLIINGKVFQANKND